MRWRGWLGAPLLRACSRTLCNLLFCFYCFGLSSAPLFLPGYLSPYSSHFGLHAVPAFFAVVVEVQGLWLLSLWGFPAGFRLPFLRGVSTVSRGLLLGLIVTICDDRVTPLSQTI